MNSIEVRPEILYGWTPKPSVCPRFISLYQPLQRLLANDEIVTKRKITFSLREIGTPTSLEDNEVVHWWQTLELYSFSESLLGLVRWSFGIATAIPLLDLLRSWKSSWVIIRLPNKRSPIKATECKFVVHHMLTMLTLARWTSWIKVVKDMMCSSTLRVRVVDHERPIVCWYLSLACGNFLWRTACAWRIRLCCSIFINVCRFTKYRSFHTESTTYLSQK